MALAAVVLTSGAACDSASVYEDCIYSTEVPPPAGGIPRCPPSVYSAEPVRARDALGRLTATPGVVVDGFVRMTASPGFLSSSAFVPATAFSDDAGLFRFAGAPLRYDLIARKDLEVLRYEAIAARYFEPCFDAPGTVRAWTAPFRLVTQEPIGNRDRIALFISGPDALTVTQPDAMGESIASFLTFESRVTIHVVEYPKDGEMADAIAYGFADVRLAASLPEIVRVKMAPIESYFDTTFDMTVPTGFDVSRSDVVVDFGTITSSAVFAKVPLQGTKRFPALPLARVAVSLKADRDGEVVDTGRRFFDPLNPLFITHVPEPPVPAAVPAAGQALPADEVLEASGVVGVYEHLLEPLDPTQPRIDVLTASRRTRLPDLREVGLTHPVGRYRWTVFSYPDLVVPEQVGSSNVREVFMRAAAKPREIIVVAPGGT